LDSECGDIDLKMISAAENSNKFQKARFWKEKSVEDVLTLGPMAEATPVVIKHVIQWLFKVLGLWINMHLSPCTPNTSSYTLTKPVFHNDYPIFHNT